VRIKDEAIVAAVELSQRYITERFLPDKAIDLIDEAASKLRLEINSVPEEIEITERKIRQMEIEREAIRRENNDERLKSLMDEISDLTREQQILRTKWNAEKEIVEKIQSRKNAIESLKLEADQAKNASGTWEKWQKSGMGKFPRRKRRSNHLNRNFLRFKKIHRW